MIVYDPAPNASTAAQRLLFVAPAADIQGEAPADWRDNAGEPITMPVAFRFGRAEVPDNLGRYLIDRGYAKRTALILPPGH